MSARDHALLVAAALATALLMAGGARAVMRWAIPDGIGLTMPVRP